MTFRMQAFVQWLLDNGADVMRKDKAGNTVLHYAAGAFEYLNIVLMLQYA